MVKDKDSQEQKNKFKEKRKWQIALRRYVLERKISPYYAPYFGLDIEKMREWFQTQFIEGIGWEDFAKKWQFDHVVPVTYFDFNVEEELKMCWSFLNLRVGVNIGKEEQVGRKDLMSAKNYFNNIYKESANDMVLKILNKIDGINQCETKITERQIQFLKEQNEYLNDLKGFSAYEFEMLNSGKLLEEVKKEMNLLKKFT